MATRKRRSTKRRRVSAKRRSNPINPVNPTRRATRRRRRSSVFARSRRRNPIINPTRRRRRIGRRRHHRNPLGGGGEVVDFAGAGMALGLFQPIVTRFAGPYLPLGQYTAPALTALSGWGLSKILEMFSFTRRFAKPARILGYSTAVIQVVQPLVARTIAGAGAAANPTGMNGRYRRPGGMNGIGVWPGIPPGMAPLPPAAPNGQGMNGMAIMPGVYR